MPARISRGLESTKQPARSRGGWWTQSDKGRIPQLIPVRHGRMIQTPFTFYRGAALNMAADLANTPATGLRVQACGIVIFQLRRVRHT